MTSIAKFILDEADARALAEALDGDDLLSTLAIGLGEAAGGRWQVAVYLSERRDDAEIAALRTLSAALLGAARSQFSLERLPDVDWVAMSLEGLPPVRAGRFFVHGRHDRHKRQPNDIAIEIEAGQAFGTGHHGTTAGCLRAIDRLVRSRPVANVLDVGTGSGVLAIAVAKAAKARVLASDIDPAAVRVARENVRLNGVAGQVEVVVSANLDKRVFRERTPYDLILANILAGPLVALAPAIGRSVAPGGTVILSGLLPDQRARIVAAYRGQGLRLTSSAELEDWLTLVFEHGRRNRKGEAFRLRPRSRRRAPPHKG